MFTKFHVGPQEFVLFKTESKMRRPIQITNCKNVLPSNEGGKTIDKCGMTVILV